MNTNNRWMPKIGGKYYIMHKSHLTKGVTKMIWQNNQLDQSYYEDMNCFKSKREALITLKLLGNAF